MTYFDAIIEQIVNQIENKDILNELNMGKGGITNQSGSQATPINNNPNGQTQTPAGSSPNQSGAPTNGATNPAVSPQASNTNAPQTQGNAVNTNNTGVDPNETMEFNNLLKLQQTDPENFNKQARILANDQNKFSRFIAHLSQPLS